MSTSVQGPLALILVALGLIGVILSFLVPDRKKSLLSLGLAGLIILSGLIQFGRQAVSNYMWHKRVTRAQQSRQADLEELRKRLREQAAETRKQVPPAGK